MAKKKASQPADESNPTPTRTFEESLAELQEIVCELEEGSLGLDESMQRFEAGIAMLRECSRTLDNAEQRIEMLTGMDADGNPVTEPFDSSASAEGAAGRRAGRVSRRTAAEDNAEEE